MTGTSGSYLGRYQPGATVPLRLSCIDWSTGGMRKPDQGPWLRVHGASGAVVDLFPVLPVEDLYGLPGLFKWPLLLGGHYAPGAYFAVYTYLVGGRSYAALDQFEVVGGSDPSGTVISLYNYHHPEANFVFAQLTSRRLVLGRNPRVS